jgi:hypothetical protein
MPGIDGYDPTMVFYHSKYWLFMNRKPHPSASAFDELFLYYTDDFRTGGWTAHPLNPIVSDVKCSRPAGRIFESNGVWFRPAQDSAKHYGHRIRLQEILVWTETDYKEKTVKIIEADWVTGLEGTHTYNSSENYVVLDAYKR